MLELETRAVLERDVSCWQASGVRRVKSSPALVRVTAATGYSPVRVLAALAAGLAAALATFLSRFPTSRLQTPEKNTSGSLL